MNHIKPSGAVCIRHLVAIACALMFIPVQLALFAPTASASQVGVVPDITWGLSQTEIDHTVSLLKESGVKWVRTNVDLSGAEYYGPGQLNTSYLSSIDYAISSVRAAGINVLMEFERTPYWASADPNKYTDSSGFHWNSYYRYNNPQDYASIVSALVSRYQGMGVQTYEVWNEPNNQAFWPSGVDAAQYTSYLKAAYPAIKAADPSATVVMGGLEPATAYTFLQGIYNAGGRGSYDVANFHIYPNGDPSLCWNGSNGLPAHDSFCLIDGLRSEMQSNNDSSPVWITELGWSTCSQSYCVSEQSQATYLGEAYQMLNTSRYGYVGVAFTYNLRNNYWSSSSSSWGDNLGLMRQDYTPKPAYYALKAAASGSATTIVPTASIANPTVQLTSPTAGSTIGSKVNIAANASDPQGVTQVTFSIDGKVVASDSSAPYTASVVTRKLANGTHTITATAYDAAGRTATSSVSVIKGEATATTASFKRIRSTSVFLSLKRSHRRASSARARRALHVVRAAGRVSGLRHGRFVVLTLMRRSGGRWIRVAVRTLRLARTGTFSRRLLLSGGTWRVWAAYGTARSHSVAVRVG
jgi:polysaccharide biosynthesis protein PslG